jgi:hypothetical protein
MLSVTVALSDAGKAPIKVRFKARLKSVTPGTFIHHGEQQTHYDYRE